MCVNSTRVYIKIAMLLLIKRIRYFTHCCVFVLSVVMEVRYCVCVCVLTLYPLLLRIGLLNLILLKTKWKKNKIIISSESDEAANLPFAANTLHARLNAWLVKKKFRLFVNVE